LGRDAEPVPGVRFIQTLHREIRPAGPPQSTLPMQPDTILHVMTPAMFGSLHCAGQTPRANWVLVTPPSGQQV